jgi:uncharacterized protein YbbC (DUF1343 family)
VSGVRPGIDVLAAAGFASLQNQRIGLVTNHTGRTADGRATVDVLAGAPSVRLALLFGPEHGIRGEVDAPVADGRDPGTGLPVVSLYGARTEPAESHLAAVDTLVFDIQDIGCRFYTYLSTLGHCLLAAARSQRRVVVLDRPNPLGGVQIDGPLAEESRLSFTAFHPIPIRHGMTLGELARLIVAERSLSVDLQVVACAGWRRADWWDATGLEWVDPSPNMRSLTAATLYPGVGLLELTNVSVGRGTDAPFEWIGAPWIDSRALARSMNDAAVPGLRVYPVAFTPRERVFAGERCHGVRFVVTDRLKLPSVRVGFEVARALRTLHGESWQASKFMALLANRPVMDSMLAGDTIAAVSRRYAPELRGFGEARKRYLLYE